MNAEIMESLKSKPFYKWGVYIDPRQEVRDERDGNHIASDALF